MVIEDDDTKDHLEIVTPSLENRSMSYSVLPSLVTLNVQNIYCVGKSVKDFRTWTELINISLLFTLLWCGKYIITVTLKDYVYFLLKNNLD